MKFGMDVVPLEGTSAVGNNKITYIQTYELGATINIEPWNVFYEVYNLY